MDLTYYSNTTTWTMVVNVAFLLATLNLLKKGNTSGATKSIFGIFSFIWLAFIYYVINSEILIPKEVSGISFYIFTLVAATLVLTFFYFSSLRKIFNNLKQEDIQWVQGLRVFVASGFLMEGVLNVIPGWFSIMDGFLHVSSGFLALIAAIAVLKNSPNQKSLLWLANIVGLADIVIIVSSINLVVWKDLGPFHNMQTVVFYTGVLLLWFHFISISKLLKSK
ncbi:Hypothetical transmembrane protein [Flavobacterium indicum GPTSA100-9 = DSM 17447]|uniref:Hypothetical transmembrane protein n=1 Tax=Flavobacterium indicum (strain DSM 17447 / CIP 109464 / GPTSA100-9) TaxID=1094466 RepID=H8XTN1_FLAIG|nr:hypothetical protein [Flavobacterium indicum]CCG53611.1 Hypothetical transmembrane protein [Flavobacterium indicum GPTSA100-9 = DSM 17447]